MGIGITLDESLKNTAPARDLFPSLSSPLLLLLSLPFFFFLPLLPFPSWHNSRGKIATVRRRYSVVGTVAVLGFWSPLPLKLGFPTWAMGRRPTTLLYSLNSEISLLNTFSNPSIIYLIKRDITLTLHPLRGPTYQSS